MSKVKVTFAPLFARFKAFIIDLFLISMPILYISAYVFLDGKDAFLHNQIVIAIDWALFGIISSLFFAKNAQTPGLRHENLYLIDIKNGQKISFIRSMIRYICFLISGASIIGLLIALFRKDRLCFHDIITQTAIVVTKK